MEVSKGFSGSCRMVLIVLFFKYVMDELFRCKLGILLYCHEIKNSFQGWRVK